MRRRGISLLEVMIVLGLVGVVSAALLPTLSGMRESALTSACKMNLHQLAVQCQNYAMTEGFFPWGMIDPSQHELNYWDNAWHRQYYGRENPTLHGVHQWAEYETFCWDFRKTIHERAGWQCGEMFNGIRADSVVCCPKCKVGTSDNWDGNRFTGYNYNVCFLGYVENDKAKRRYPTAYAAVTHPSRVVVFGDGGYAGGPNKFMRAPFQDKKYDNSPASLRKAGTQAFRHGSGVTRHCNMAFLDGHVEEFRQPYRAGGAKGWVDEKTHSAFISSGNGIYGPRGFGVADEDEPQL